MTGQLFPARPCGAGSKSPAHGSRRWQRMNEREFLRPRRGSRAISVSPPADSGNAAAFNRVALLGLLLVLLSAWMALEQFFVLLRPGVVLRERHSSMLVVCCA